MLFAIKLLAPICCCCSAIVALLLAVGASFGSEFPTTTVSTSVAVDSSPPGDGSFQPPAVQDAPDLDPQDVFRQDPSYSSGAAAAAKVHTAPVQVNSTATATIARAAPGAVGEQLGSALAETATLPNVTPVQTSWAQAEAQGTAIGNAQVPSVTPSSVLPRGDLITTSTADSHAARQAAADAASDPVIPGANEFVIRQLDLELSGAGLPFRLERIYRNRWSYDGPMGWNWTHSYDQRLVIAAAACNRVVHWLAGDGTVVRFDETLTGTWVPTPQIPEALSSNSDGSFILTHPDGVRTKFRADGTMQELRDLNDNVIAFTWGAVKGVAVGGPPRLLSAVDTLGRTISFRYGSDGYLDQVEVPSPVSATITYDVNAMGDLASVTGAGGVLERYEYASGFAAPAVPFVPTADIRSFCESACGTDPETCHGESPCEKAAEPIVAQCVTDCFKPQQCLAQCGQCEAKCEALPENATCAAGCQPMCAGICKLDATAACILKSVSAVRTACGDACVDSCRDKCDPTLVCTGHGIVIGAGSDGIGVSNWVQDVCVGTSRGQAIRFDTNGGRYKDCDHANTRGGTIFNGFDQDGPHTGGVCTPISSAGWCCNADCYDCCLQGDNCPGSATCQGHGGSCQDDCMKVFLSGQDGLGSSCRSGAGSGCLGKSAAACDTGCGTACSQSCAKACAATCNTECAASCNSKTTCQRACGAQAGVGRCNTSCIDTCVAKNTHPSGEATFGTPEDANHNLLRVKDALGVVGVENYFGEDILSPNFDRVTSQVFGTDTISYHRHDLTTPGAPAVPAAAAPYVALSNDFVEVCPMICLGGAHRPELRPGRWVEIQAGEYLVMERPDGDLPGESWPITESKSLGGYRWYELRRTGDTTAVLWPPVKLPTKGVLVHTPSGTLTLKQGEGKAGRVAMEGLTAKTRDALLGPGGKGMVITFAQTAAGWRAFQGRGVGAVQISPPGACNSELRLAADEDGRPVLGKADACTGMVTVREIGRRKPPAGESPWQGLLSDPSGASTWVFERGTGRRVGFSPRGDAWRQGDPWGGLCDPPHEISVDPGCIDSVADMMKNRGPGVPVPGCGNPWANRGGAGTTGYTPDPGSDDVSMGCGPGGVDIPPVVPACEVEAYTDPATGAHTKRAQPIASVAVVRDAAGIVWSYYLGARGEFLRVVNNSSGARVDRNYDPLGRQIGERSAFGDRVCTTYDESWNPVRVVSLPAPGRYKPAAQLERRVSFAAFGRPSAIWDPNELDTPLVTYHYDPKMNLTSEEPAAPAPAVTYRHDSRGRVDRITRADGTHTTLTYASTGAVETIRMAEGTALQAVQTLTSDPFGRVSSITQPGKPTLSYDWLKDGRPAGRGITLETGGQTLATVYGYDAAGRLTSVSGPQTSQILTLNRRGLLESVEERATDASPVRRQCFRYDGRGKLVESVDPEGRRIRLTRDGNGEVTRVERGIWTGTGSWDDLCEHLVTDGAAAATEVISTVTRGVSGRVDTEETGQAPAGQPAWSRSYTYDGYGRLVESILGTGERVRTGYDARGDVRWRAVYKSGAPALGADLLTSRFGPNGIPNPAGTSLAALSTFDYDPISRPTEQRTYWFVDKLSQARRFLGAGEYQSRLIRWLDAQNAVETVDPLGHVSRIERDALGRVARLVMLDGTTTVTHTFADSGRQVTRTISPAAAAGGRLVQTLQLDDSGQLKSVHAGATLRSVERDALGRTRRVSDRALTVEYGYNGFGEIVSASRLRGATLETQATFVRNRLGAVSSQTDGRSNATSLSFDALNRLSHETFPDGTSIAFGYRRGTGSPLTRTDRNGDVQTYAYDAYGELASVSASAAGAPAGWKGVISLSFTRNALGLVSATDTNRPGDARDDVTYEWLLDSTGQSVEETSSLFRSDVAMYTRDALTRPLTVSLAGAVQDYDYDALGRLSTVRLGATTLATYKYRGAGGATRITYGSGLVEDFTYDDEGRRRTARAAMDSAPRFGQDYTWGADGTLVRVDRWAGARPATPPADLFLADDFGRLVASSQAVPGLPVWTSGTVRHAAISSALAGGTTRESWDLDASDNWRSATFNGVSTSSTLGSDNRLIGFGGAIAVDAQGQTTRLPSGATYGYDGLGRLVTAKLPGGAKWSFRHDPLGRLVSATGPQGATQFQFTGGALREVTGSSSALHLPGAEGMPVAVSTGGAVQYDHGLHGQRVGWATGGTGDVTERYDYSAYGEPTLRGRTGAVLAGSAVGNRLFVAGQPWFRELELHRFGKRWYRPMLGRFLTPDPAGLSAGPNRYSYVGAQPTRLVDPTGLDQQQPAAGLKEAATDLVGREPSLRDVAANYATGTATNATSLAGTLLLGTGGLLSGVGNDPGLSVFWTGSSRPLADAVHYATALEAATHAVQSGLATEALETTLLYRVPQPALGPLWKFAKELESPLLKNLIARHIFYPMSATYGFMAGVSGRGSLTLIDPTDPRLPIGRIFTGAERPAYYLGQKAIPYVKGFGYGLAGAGFLLQSTQDSPQVTGANPDFADFNHVADRMDSELDYFALWALSKLGLYDGPLPLKPWK